MTRRKPIAKTWGIGQCEILRKFISACAGSLTNERAMMVLRPAKAILATGGVTVFVMIASSSKSFSQLRL